MAGALRGRQQRGQISHSHPCSCFWGAEAALPGQGSCPLDDRKPFPFSRHQESALANSTSNFNLNGFALACFVHGDQIHSQLGTV